MTQQVRATDRQTYEWDSATVAWSSWSSHGRREWTCASTTARVSRLTVSRSSASSASSCRRCCAWKQSTRRLLRHRYTRYLDWSRTRYADVQLFCRISRPGISEFVLRFLEMPTSWGSVPSAAPPFVWHFHRCLFRSSGPKPSYIYGLKPELKRHIPKPILFTERMYYFDMYRLVTILRKVAFVGQSVGETYQFYHSCSDVYTYTRPWQADRGVVWDTHASKLMERWRRWRHTAGRWLVVAVCSSSTVGCREGRCSRRPRTTSSSSLFIISPLATSSTVTQTYYNSYIWFFTFWYFEQFQVLVANNPKNGMLYCGITQPKIWLWRNSQSPLLSH